MALAMNSMRQVRAWGGFFLFFMFSTRSSIRGSRELKQNLMIAVRAARTSLTSFFSLALKTIACVMGLTVDEKSPLIPSASRATIRRELICNWMWGTTPPPCRRKALQCWIISWTSQPLFTFGLGPRASMTSCSPLSCSDHFSETIKLAKSVDLSLLTISTSSTYSLPSTPYPPTPPPLLAFNAASVTACCSVPV